MKIVVLCPVALSCLVLSRYNVFVFLCQLCCSLLCVDVVFCFCSLGSAVSTGSIESISTEDSYQRALDVERCVY